jgi:hypothetical protein
MMNGIRRRREDGSWCLVGFGVCMVVLSLQLLICELSVFGEFDLVQCLSSFLLLSSFSFPSCFPLISLCFVRDA